MSVKLLIALTSSELYGRSLLLFCASTPSPATAGPCWIPHALTHERHQQTDVVYVQLEQSLEACKTHESLRGLYELLPEFARVCTTRELA